MLVHLGSEDLGERFFKRRWPEASAISDPEGKLYDAFDVERARWTQLFGLSVLLKGVKAALTGHGVGKPGGDVMRMPAAFLIHDSKIVWAQEPKHVADHPNLAAVHAMTLMINQREAASQAAQGAERKRTVSEPS
ncbi:MAG: hypothetical protein QNJ90_12270 [Planctomycetota bacterium]|nr:hypothetical protein [Planctomycetota bacterium]